MAKKNLANDGFKEVSLSATYLKPAEMEAGQTIQGVYEEAREGNFDNITYMIRTEDGLVGINATGKLEKLMDNVAVGSTVRIEYLGTTKIEKGKWAGKPAHDFKVSVAEAEAL